MKLFEKKFYKNIGTQLKKYGFVLKKTNDYKKYVFSKIENSMERQIYFYFESFSGFFEVGSIQISVYDLDILNAYKKLLGTKDGFGYGTRFGSWDDEKTLIKPYEKDIEKFLKPKITSKNFDIFYPNFEQLCEQVFEQIQQYAFPFFEKYSSSEKAFFELRKLEKDWSTDRKLDPLNVLVRKLYEKKLNQKSFVSETNPEFVEQLKNDYPKGTFKTDFSSLEKRLENYQF